MKTTLISKIFLKNSLIYINFKIFLKNSLIILIFILTVLNIIALIILLNKSFTNLFFFFKDILLYLSILSKIQFLIKKHHHLIEIITKLNSLGIKYKKMFKTKYIPEAYENLLNQTCLTAILCFFKKLKVLFSAPRH